MKPSMRLLLLLLTGVLVGVTANVGLQPAQPPVPVQEIDDTADWTAGTLAVAELAPGLDVEAVWQSLAPWGSPPPPPSTTAEAEPEPPAPRLIGVVRSGRAYRAVFMIEGAGQLILAPGARLPGGGRVLSVAGLRVSWIDAKGQRHNRQVFDTYQEVVQP